jgi:hypothetical protein
MAAALAILKWVGIGLGLFVLIVVVGFLVVPPTTRSLTDAWGATAEEVATSLPGDDLFPAQREVSTKAVSIDAPPDVVYALIQQMGQHRAGWYGWDWFYRATGSADFVDGRSSERIVPELQGVQVGDTIHINDMVAYEVVRADPGEALVMVAGTLTADQLGTDPYPRRGRRTRWRGCSGPPATAARGSSCGCELTGPRPASRGGSGTGPSTSVGRCSRARR